MAICSYCKTEYPLKPSKVKQNKRGVFFCCIEHKKAYYKENPTTKDKPESARARSKRHLENIKKDEKKLAEHRSKRRIQALKRKYGEYWETKATVLEMSKILKEDLKNERKKKTNDTR